ncbi:MAG: hypothetical protein FJ098_00390 [Deltaproteobacteria bacterium]|nr:hypothetical protein [Deltaproteobacteria bacterium]
MTRLDFALPPSSPAGLAVLAAGILLLVLFLLRLRRLGLRGRMLPLLLAARGLSLAALVLLLLGPVRVEERTAELPFPAEQTTVPLPLAEGPALDAWLPPASRWTPRAPEAGDRVRLRTAAPPLLALYKNRDEVRVELETDLRAPHTVEVSLFDLSGEGDPGGGRRELRRRDVPLPAGRHRVDVELPFLPDRMGELLLGVRLACPPGLLCEEEEALAPVQVVRESLRILHVAGHPSWDLRFLREHLRSRPGHEVVSFYVLANQENFQPLTPDEVALIPFPTDELFLQELPGFDLLVIQDFPLGSYFPLRREHLESMAAFVRAGGGLLLLGGGQAFSTGGVHGTPVAEVLPVAPPEVLPRAEGAPQPPEEYRPVRTRVGAAHPVTALEEAEGELPALTGWNLLGGPRPGAQVLLEAPGDRPLLVTGEAGAGRVAVLGTDSLWTWAFPDGSAPSSPRLYEALLDHLVRWLTRDPEMDALRLRTGGPAVLAGNVAEVEACLRGGEPPGGREVAWQARWTGLAAAPPREASGMARTGDDGCTRFPLPAAEAGGWRVHASVRSAARVLEGEGIVGVHPHRRSEQARVAARLVASLPPPLLPLLAPPPPEHRVFPETVSLSWEVSRPLWLHPLVLVAVAALLALDWALRRRHGML